MEFNKSKSCIKWYEYSALGVPCVVSSVKPYSTEINTANSMPYNSPEEFKIQLKRLIESKRLREEIGREAWKWVKKNRDLKNIAKDYINIFKKIWKIKIT